MLNDIYKISWLIGWLFGWLAGWLLFRLLLKWKNQVMYVELGVMISKGERVNIISF